MRRGTAENELRRLGGGRQWRGIGHGTDLDGEEREEEGEQNSENGQTRVRRPLEVEDDHGDNQSD